MKTIDLDAIAVRLIDARTHYTKIMIARAAMKEAIHQALVLAGEKATIKMVREERTRDVYPYVDKQSILDVEKLIV